MWITPIKRLIHVWLFCSIFKMVYFLRITRRGEVKLALIPLLFSSTRGNYAPNLVHLTTGFINLHLFAVLPSFVGGKRTLRWVSGVNCLSFLLWEEKESLWHDVPKVSCSDYVECLTAIASHPKTWCLAQLNIGSNLPPPSYHLIFLIFARQRLFESSPLLSHYPSYFRMTNKPTDVCLFSSHLPDLSMVCEECILIYVDQYCLEYIM